jgi:pyrroline-5-carboxylate reductase
MSSTSPANDPLRIGLVGVGTIGSAVVKGIVLAMSTNSITNVVKPIHVSPRNADKAAALVEACGSDTVQVCESNQQVVDSCDVLFIGVHHSIFAGVVEGLTFKTGQTVIYLAVTAYDEACAALQARGVSPSDIVRATPLPACDRGAGTTLLYPPNHPIATLLFTPLGGVVQVQKVEHIARLQAATCLMGDLYTRMKVAQDWIVDGGIDEAMAAQFVGSVFTSIVRDARDRSQTDAHAFAELVAEQTAGGLNERVIREQRAAGAYEAYVKSMDDLVEK